MTCTWSEISQETSGRAGIWTSTVDYPSLVINPNCQCSRLVQRQEECAPSIQPSANQFPSQVRFTAQGPKRSLFSHGEDVFRTWVLAELLGKLLCSALTAEVSKFSFSVLEYKSIGTRFQGGEQGKTTRFTPDKSEESAGVGCYIEEKVNSVSWTGQLGWWSPDLNHNAIYFLSVVGPDLALESAVVWGGVRASLLSVEICLVICLCFHGASLCLSSCSLFLIQWRGIGTLKSYSLDLTWGLV